MNMVALRWGIAEPKLSLVSSIFEPYSWHPMFTEQSLNIHGKVDSMPAGEEQVFAPFILLGWS